MAIELLTLYETDHCTCGKVHRFAGDVRIGNGVVRELPQILKTWGARKAFLIADAITNQVAAEQVRALLKADGIATADCVFREEHPEPDEHSVGYALMYFQTDCDVIIGVGSGVINISASWLPKPAENRISLSQRPPLWMAMLHPRHQWNAQD